MCHSKNQQEFHAKQFVVHAVITLTFVSMFKIRNMEQDGSKPGTTTQCADGNLKR